MLIHNLITMQSYILPTLSVSNGKAAIAFYQKAFDAEVLASNEDPDGNVVAELAIQGAKIIVADASPEHGNYAPGDLQGISVRLGLMCDDPDALAEKAVAAGITTVYPVADQSYGYRLGHFIDPFGHHWEIGRPIKEF